MNPNRLQAFVTIVQKSSYTLAAEALYTTQSALSQQIRTLEGSLGAALFDHSVHRVALTEAGKAFYPRAQEILRLYQDALFDVRLAEHKSQYYSLRVGCVYDQITQYWVDLYHLSPEVEQKYKPVAQRFENRLELYQAIRTGAADICISMENHYIGDFGLEFMPLVTCPEMCVTLYSNASPEKEELTPEDLSPYWIAFHYPEGYVQYEDDLRRELSGRPGGARLLNPSDFPKVEYGISVLLLEPMLRFPASKLRYARPLLWGDGIRAGFVLRKDCSPLVRGYAETIRDIIKEKGNPWIL